MGEGAGCLACAVRGWEWSLPQVRAGDTDGACPTSALGQRGCAGLDVAGGGRNGAGVVALRGAGAGVGFS